MAKHWKYRITTQRANSIDGHTTPEANYVKSISYCWEFTPWLLQKKQTESCLTFVQRLKTPYILQFNQKKVVALPHGYS